MSVLHTIYLILVSLIIGMASGISSSAPVGPANLWIATAVIPPKRKLKNIIAFIFGVIVIDILYAFVAFWGYFTYLQGKALNKWVGLVGGIGLVILGIFEYFDTKKKHHKQDDYVQEELSEYHSPLKDFSVGIFLCTSNPAFVLFWVFVASVAHNWGVENLKSWKAVFVFLGIALGDLLWYLGFMKMVKKGLKLVSQKFIGYVRMAIAIGFVAFGMAAFLKSIL